MWWTTDVTEAYENIQKFLAKSTLLTHLKEEAPLALFTDVSDIPNLVLRKENTKRIVVSAIYQVIEYFWYNKS